MAARAWLLLALLSGSAAAHPVDEVVQGAYLTLVPGEVAVYRAVADRGELTTRTRLMFWVMPQATMADTLAYVDSLPMPGSVAGDGLGIWGLKLGMDGGVEGGFLCEPYANNPAFRGHAF